MQTVSIIDERIEKERKRQRGKKDLENTLHADGRQKRNRQRDIDTTLTMNIENVCSYQTNRNTSTGTIDTRDHLLTNWWQDIGNLLFEDKSQLVCISA